uniref:hypothetical protein n=1 Tax=Cryptomonas gyropyrenoidosa TaxID=233257 RepID=UPI00279E02E6|nr:hypothetical protein QLP26_mgp13 [Cryptomonas gyropyrenoidosa]WFQ82702.1 hypothetical protein [Cryptomonas gyropyrenoidosa]
MTNNYFYNKTILNLKIFVGFFTLCNNCIANLCILKGTNSFSIDIGFKYTINKVFLNPIANISLKIVNLQNLYDDLNLYFFNANNFFSNRNYINILKVAYKYKYILSGKILNHVNKGLSVGIFGYVCFLPKKYLGSHKINSLFQITKISYPNKKFKLSQKKILIISNKLMLAFRIKSFRFFKNKSIKY